MKSKIMSPKDSNDLLGLHQTTNMSSNNTITSSDAGPQSIQTNNEPQSHASPTHNELLNLHYEPMPTADLLGFSQSQLDATMTGSGSQSNPNNSTVFSNSASDGNDNSKINNELLSLDYTPTNTAAMQLNDAYIALEQMRVANLQIELGVSHIDQHKCVQCIRNLPPSSLSKKSVFGKSFRFKNDKPCLMCGCPTCKKHSDASFLKSKIAICSECSPLFSLDFIIECVCLNIAAEGEEENDSGNSTNVGDNIDDNSHQNKQPLFIQAPNFNNKKPTSPISVPNNVPLSPKEKLRRQNIKHMIDVYDRVHLMLTYSVQFIDEIAHKLETNTKREDQVGVSSNTIGIASGLAGIAAAAAVVTPAGPPLIIASLLFGATAQASASGSKLVNYYSAPNKIALKIISYYNLIKSILVVTNVLKDALLEGDIKIEQYVSRMVKAHDEAMIQFNAIDDEDGNNNTGGGDKGNSSWDQVDDLTQMPHNQNNEVDYEDDWETDDDDSTVMSMRSKASQMNNSSTLQGIKEDCEIDPSEFGDFQSAECTDKTSQLSPKRSPSSKNKNKTAQTQTPEKSKKGTEDTLMERDDTAGKLARFYSRTSLAGSSLVGAATVTVFAGAALSLAHVAFEANNFAANIKRLQAGSPSKQAKILRCIKEDVKKIPNTSVVAEEWEKYLAVLDENRRNGKTNNDNTKEAEKESTFETIDIDGDTNKNTKNDDLD